MRRERVVNKLRELGYKFVRLEVNEVAGHKCTPAELELCNAWLPGRVASDTCQVTGVHVAPRAPTP